APLEGLTKIEAEEKGVIGHVAGPIRNAGGAGSAMATLIADYVRQGIRYALSQTQPEEIATTIQEHYAYHHDVTRLQYLPTKEQLQILLQHIPPQITAPITDKSSTHTGIRGGVCLLLSAGFCLKAPKLHQLITTSTLADTFKQQWAFLSQIQPKK